MSNMENIKVRICSNCGVGHLDLDTRDVTITRQSRTAVVQNVTGFFCNTCDEIEFDDTTDSAARYADAGDKLVLDLRAGAIFNVHAAWDPAASVWVATSADVPGLVAEAATLAALEAKLQDLVPELLEANGRDVPAQLRIEIRAAECFIHR